MDYIDKMYYMICTDCDESFDLYKYRDLESAGHDGHNVRVVTPQEFVEMLTTCKFDGCLDEEHLDNEVTDAQDNLKFILEMLGYVIKDTTKKLSL